MEILQYNVTIREYWRCAILSLWSSCVTVTERRFEQHISAAQTNMYVTGPISTMHVHAILYLMLNEHIPLLDVCLQKGIHTVSRCPIEHFNTSRKFICLFTVKILSVCLVTHHATWGGGVGVYFHAFLISTLDREKAVGFMPLGKSLRG
jgi:hypothetical protein